MNISFLELLRQANSEQERSWIITQSFLETLSPELSTATKAVAMPHWFNQAVLVALCPDLSQNEKQIEQIYEKLKNFPFVEIFPERGYNIHDSTRKMMLKDLWQNKPSQFIELSRRTENYFANCPNKEKPENQIEWLYHLVLIDSEKGAKKIKAISSNWNDNFRFSELESLVNVLLEHVEENRVEGLTKALILYRQGKNFLRLERAEEALEILDKAKKELFQDVSPEANILRADIDKTIRQATEATETVILPLVNLSQWLQKVSESVNKIVESGEKIIIQLGWQPVENLVGSEAFAYSVAYRHRIAGELRENKDRQDAQKAIYELIEQLHTSKNEKATKEAINKLGEIGIGNPDAIKALIELLDSSYDQEICWQVSKNLEKIDRGNPKAGVRLGKLINLGEKCQVELIVHCRPSTENERQQAAAEGIRHPRQILIQVRGRGGINILPEGLKMILLDESGNPLLEEKAQERENSLQKPFIGEPGECFGVKIEIGNTSQKENFEI